MLKRFRVEKQKKYITMLKEMLDSNHERKDVVEEFLLLSKEEVTTLLGTGLIDIGAHTVSHEILTNISPKEAQNQIVESKDIIEKYFGEEISLFAYPNGTELDYSDEHIESLKESGFNCSVTTTPKLNDLQGNPYRLGRMSVGPDYSSNLNYLALRASGFISVLKSNGRKNYV
jgi:peptidoglycan/xylan/chitin deacetylase (PgdA/CDA1 family)